MNNPANNAFKTDALSTLLKILLLSLTISVAIKFLPVLEKVPETSSLALFMVLSPSILMAGLLLWRSKAAQE